MHGDFRVGDWIVTPKLNSLSMNGKSARLEPKVMQVLVCLAESPEVVAKEKLMRTVWADTFVTDDVLTRSISELRKVFADDPKNPRYIQTIPKGGYRLIPQVVRTNLSSSPADSQPESSLPAAPALQIEKPTRSRIPLLLTGFLVLLLLTYAIGRHYSSLPVFAGRVMLAVLPFENLNHDPQQDYFSDGLTAEMISQFGRLPSDRLGVIAWGSAVKYKATNKSQDEIGHELGANYLLEGTVRRSGNQVRITAELLQVGKPEHIWSNGYDGNLDDVLSLQNQVAREIASEIRVQLNPQDWARLGTPQSINGQGYDAYLKAKVQPDMVGGKVETLQQAIRLNPNYAPPYIAVAMAYRQLASRGFADPDESYRSARTAINKALELDPESAAAHRELGWILWRHEWNFPEAENEFRHAIALAPNDVLTRDTFELFLKSMGRFDEALEESLIQLKFSPREPYSRANAGSLLGLMKRYNEAMRQFQIGMEVAPTEAYVYERMGPVLIMLGEKERAIEALEKARDYSDGQQDKLAWLGYAYAISGKKSNALDVLEQLKKMSAQHGYVSSLHLALLYNGLGRKEDALAALEDAYRRRDEYLVYLKVYPEFENLRSEQRYQDLERKVGLMQLIR